MPAVRRKRRTKAKFWFEGGTLHEATLSEWFNLDELMHPDDHIANQMATAADFVVNARELPGVDHNIHFSDPNELLVLYVNPLIAAMNMQRRNPELHHWHVKNVALLTLFHMGLISKNVVEQEIDRIRAEEVRAKHE